MNGTDQQLTDDSHDPTDQTLLRRFKCGEADAATELYIRYANRLEQLASKQTSPDLAFRVSSDEIVQSVFRTFFRRASIGQYDVAQGEDLWKLLLIISLNKIRSQSEFHRAQKRDVGKTITLKNEFFQNQSSAKDGNETAYVILKMTVDELLDDLPAGHADIVRLRIENQTLPAIAKKIGRSHRTVERVLQKFRDKLLEIVEE